MFSFLRVIKFALLDIGRNISLSFMTVFILILMLLSVNVLWSLDVITKRAVGSVKQQVDISFYLVPKTTTSTIADMEKYIKSFPEITSFTVLTSDQVFSNFKSRHANQMDTIDALNELGSNPFGPTIIIQTKEPKDYKKIVKALTVPEYKNVIESRSFDQHKDVIDKLQNITNRIETIGFGLTVLFAIISFLIIFNTIRVAINTQRAEISIKRLVGASNWFIRGPYLIEALLFTIFSVALTFVIVFISFNWLDVYLSIILPNGFNLTNYYKSNIIILLGIQSIAVLLLTVISSLLAMRRQLKV